ncbi:MAG: hypothetical protein IKG46_08230 [Solobacterium sp.]|nr:hypothetical protein [Solobacterium sp.]
MKKSAKLLAASLLTMGMASCTAVDPESEIPEAVYGPPFTEEEEDPEEYDPQEEMPEEEMPIEEMPQDGALEGQ